MAKNLVIKNPEGVQQVYQNVESIILKDINDNNIEYVEKPVKTTGKYHCMVIDHDGTVLKDEWLNNGDVFTMPTPPKHERLTFQEWSCSQELTNDETIVNNADIIAGTLYTTISGKTEFNIELTKATGLSVTCKMTGEKDWGDGVIDSETSHTYLDYGKYIITSSASSIPQKIFEQESSTPNFYVISISIGLSVTSFTTNAFSYCYCLESLSIPSKLYGYDTIDSRISYRIIDNCPNLKVFITPNNKQTRYSFALPNKAFENCYNLKYVVLSNTITNINDATFNNNYSLDNIIFPQKINSLYISGISAITNPSISLKKITTLGSITMIGRRLLSLDYNNLRIIDLTHNNTIPTLSDFSNTYNKLLKIIIPDALYDEWISATNWVNYVDYIYKASEVNTNA